RTTAKAARYSARLSRVESAIRSSTVEASFSQMRGGPAKYVGDTSRRFWKRVSTLSAKFTTYPWWMALKTDVKFSKMWANGRYEITSSVSRRGSVSAIAPSTHRMLRWVSMAPLGGPVVPDV